LFFQSSSVTVLAKSVSPFGPYLYSDTKDISLCGFFDTIDRPNVIGDIHFVLFLLIYILANKLLGTIFGLSWLNAWYFPRNFRKKGPFGVL